LLVISPADLVFYYAVKFMIVFVLYRFRKGAGGRKHFIRPERYVSAPGA
jgi:hypothetical protein